MTAKREPADLSAVEAVRLIATGSLTAESLMRSCLERILHREPLVQAFEHIGSDDALDQARALDRIPPRGPLHGLPFAAKDNYDTFDMPTTSGSPIYTGNRPTCDASTVALARGAGAILVGKTVTTEFAYVKPGKTRNPHDPTRAPGGSSSGSAAAVAAGMVPLAFGSQTVGSVIRPAAFCGAAAFKPTFDLLPVTGIKSMAWSLDTAGVFGRTVADCALLVDALLGTDYLAGLGGAQPPSIVLCRTHDWPDAQPETGAALEQAGSCFAKAGAKIRAIELPSDFSALRESLMIVLGFEMAKVLAPETARHRHLLSPQLREQVEKGRAIPFAEYSTAKSTAAAYRARLGDLFGDGDVLMAHASSGEAPVGNAYTGFSFFNGVCTMLGTPCVNVPGLKGPKGLPVGVQAVGRIGEDARTLAAANWMALRLS
jgi:Asp-tRNA(Asn)/Glu-tRNA(Gln) amidotransferase A subunit family amidase